MSEYKGTPALDAGLIAAAQAVEHYEITRYGTLKRWAEVLGMADVAELLDATLQEEAKTDDALAGLADAAANQRAVAADNHRPLRAGPSPRPNYRLPAKSGTAEERNSAQGSRTLATRAGAFATRAGAFATVKSAGPISGPSSSQSSGIETGAPARARVP